MGYDPRCLETGQESSTEWHFIENWSGTEVVHIPLEHFPFVVSEIHQCQLGESPGLGPWAASSNQADTDWKTEGESAEKYFTFPSSRRCVLGLLGLQGQHCASGVVHESVDLCMHARESCGLDIKIVFPNCIRSNWATSTLEERLPRAVMWREESPGKPNNCDLIPWNAYCYHQYSLLIWDYFSLTLGKTLISTSLFLRKVK